MSFRYQVALSFAGEERVYVEEVATELRSRGVTLFYDKFDTASLWGKNLYDHLSDLYQNQAEFVVMFASAAYKAKSWANLERQSAQAGAFASRRDSILPAKFDDTEIPGVLSTVGYVDLRKTTPVELAELICQKLVAGGHTLGPPTVNATGSPTNLIAGNSVTITVLTDTGAPIEGAQVRLVAENGIAYGGATDTTGCVKIEVPYRRSLTILCGHPDHPAFTSAGFDPVTDFTITLPNRENVGSLVAGPDPFFIPNLEASIEPKNEQRERFYGYFGGASVNGQPAWPAFFALDEKLLVEDGNGAQFYVWFRDVRGTSYLIEHSEVDPEANAAKGKNTRYLRPGESMPEPKPHVVVYRSNSG